jgi:hypothetical protein
MDLTVIHCLDLTIALFAMLVMYSILKDIDRNEFITTMLVMSMALMFNIVIFSSVFLIDNLDHILYSNIFYNWWSSFIRMQDCVTVLWIAVYALLRIKRTTLKEVGINILLNIRIGFNKVIKFLIEIYTKVRGLRN